MSVSVVKGDLFDPNFGFTAIGHGVNCVGKMGAGIALAFRQKFPEMYERYVLMCRYGILKPGGSFVYTSPQNETVLNLASQMYTGANAKEEWLACALYGAVTKMGHPFMSIGLPWIGAGIGGLSTQDTLAVVSDVATLLPNTKFTIVEL